MIIRAIEPGGHLRGAGCRLIGDGVAVSIFFG